MRFKRDRCVRLVSDTTAQSLLVGIGESYCSIAVFGAAHTINYSACSAESYTWKHVFSLRSLLLLTIHMNFSVDVLVKDACWNCIKKIKRNSNTT